MEFWDSNSDHWNVRISSRPDWCTYTSSKLKCNGGRMRIRRHSIRSEETLRSSPSGDGAWLLLSGQRRSHSTHWEKTPRTFLGILSFCRVEVIIFLFRLLDMLLNKPQKIRVLLRSTPANTVGIVMNRQSNSRKSTAPRVIR